MNIATQAIRIIKAENPSVNLAYLEDIASDCQQSLITDNECYIIVKAFCKGLSAVGAIDSYEALDKISAIHSQQAEG